MFKKMMLTTVSACLVLMLGNVIVSAQPAAEKSGWAARAFSGPQRREARGYT